MLAYPTKRNLYIISYNVVTLFVINSNEPNIIGLKWVRQMNVVSFG